MTRRIAADRRGQRPPVRRIADLGCGQGASALILADIFDSARVLAVDRMTAFVESLRRRAADLGLSARLQAVAADMAKPPALDGHEGGFDLIWAESSIYTLGRRAALEAWRPLLSSAGEVVFSDLVWTRPASQRAPEAVAFWSTEYPQLTTAEGVAADITAAGFECRAQQVADAAAWRRYGEPIRVRLQQMATDPDLPAPWRPLIAEFERELAIHRRFGDQVLACFFTAAPPTS